MNRVLVVAAAMLAAACNLKPQSEKVAKQDPPFVFPHAPHLEGDVDCLLCHGGIDQATKLDANVRHVKLPAKISKSDECSGCHDTEPKVTVPARHQPFRLSFSHADHVSRVKGNCKACHDPATLPDKGGKEYGYPAMAKCTACHNHQADYNQARCTPCHTDLKGLVPVQTYAHQGDWLRLHGQFAKPVAASCAQCHDQTYCNECH
jgi:c(7)-type cytochrome triheme protein